MEEGEERKRRREQTTPEEGNQPARRRRGHDRKNEKQEKYKKKYKREILTKKIKPRCAAIKLLHCETLKRDFYKREIIKSLEKIKKLY